MQINIILSKNDIICLNQKVKNLVKPKFLITKKKNYTFDENVSNFVKNVIFDSKNKIDNNLDVLSISSNVLDDNCLMTDDNISYNETDNNFMEKIKNNNPKVYDFFNDNIDEFNNILHL